jgi:predicted cobalt transporter CbtA
MQAHDHSTPETPPMPAGDASSRRAWWVFGGFAAFGLILIALDHRAHLLGWLPWLFLGGCLLLHVFMHGGHGGASRKEDDK